MGYAPIMMSVWASYLNLDQCCGSIRIDDAKPETSFLDQYSRTKVTELHVYGGREADARFVSKLLDAKRVRLQLPQYGNDPVFDFPIGDSGVAAIKEVVEVCDRYKTKA